MSLSHFALVLAPLPGVILKLLLAYLAAWSAALAPGVGRALALWLAHHCRSAVVRATLRPLIIYAQARVAGVGADRFAYVFGVAHRALPWLDQQSLAHAIEAELASVRLALGAVLPVLTPPTPPTPTTSASGKETLS